MKTKHNGVMLVSVIAAIVGLVVSFSLLKEDVLSTAKTLFEYFPSKFGVTPAMSWEGAIHLGIFVSVAQVVTISAASRVDLAKAIRWSAGAVIGPAILFDAWTDIVFRSGDFTGNPVVATVTTIAFYTFGSEFLQSLSWIVVLTSWRQAVRELMHFTAKLFEGIRSIGSEWAVIVRNARSQEQRSIVRSNPNTTYNADVGQPTHYKTPTTPSQSATYPRVAPKTPTIQRGFPNFRSPEDPPEPTYHPIG